MLTPRRPPHRQVRLDARDGTPGQDCALVIGRGWHAGVTATRSDRVSPTSPRARSAGVRSRPGVSSHHGTDGLAGCGWRENWCVPAPRWIALPSGFDSRAPHQFGSSREVAPPPWTTHVGVGSHPRHEECRAIPHGDEGLTRHPLGRTERAKPPRRRAVRGGRLRSTSNPSPAHASHRAPRGRTRSTPTALSRCRALPPCRAVEPPPTAPPASRGPSSV